MGIFTRSTVSRKPNESMRLIVTTFVGVVFGFLIGLSFPKLSLTKFNISSGILTTIDIKYTEYTNSVPSGSTPLQHPIDNNRSSANATSKKIWVPSNPRGAERLPPGIVKAESDLYLRRLWGKPNEDLTSTPKYLVTFTVGYNQRKNIDAAVKKVSLSLYICVCVCVCVRTYESVCVKEFYHPSLSLRWSNN
ncbi:hypothetical protein Gotri_015027 [Gossypium trilobum]|uniref:Uncharacterized protein n=1 Tax=Gossypium trilobum TaxID=34281 RepID=A0A7J9DYX1_9ROSI|nr:hypothetical protein [Gossypium trilobum]